MKNKSILLWSILGCIAWMFTACVEPELSMYGTISGVVKDAITNKPVEGVRITLTPRGLSQVTESDGQFMFTDLEAGEYTLTFEKVGYAESTQKIAVVAGNSTSVQVTLNENQLGVDISPQQLNFGASTSSLQLIMQSDGRTAYYKASVTADWITLSQTDGSITGKEVLYVSVSRAGLAPGEYTGSIRIAINDKYSTIPVLMTVTKSSEAIVSLERITKTTSSEIYAEGVLLSIGGEKGVTDFGICYSPTNNAPSINDTKQTLGSSTEPKSFSCTLTGLKADQLYYLRAYAINEKGIAYSDVLTAQTEKSGIQSEDYSSAKVESGNYKVDLTMQSCKRTSNRVTIEAMITNNSISPYTGFYTQSLGNSNVAGQSHIEDDVYTNYNANSLNVYLGDRSGAYIYNASLPTGTPKKLTVTIDNVPQNAKTISVYIAAEFINIQPNEYCLLTFENVPIY